MIASPRPDDLLACHGTPRRLPGVLVVGLGTAVAMWFLGYLGRLPALGLPAPLLLGGLVVAQFLGAWAAGRFAGRGGALAGAGAGLITGLANLLVLGSVISRAADPEAPDVTPTAIPSAPLWVAGFLATGAGIGAAAGALARRGAPSVPTVSWAAVRWTGILAWVAAGATFLLLLLGGVVTSYGAGLDVPDWPTSFGANMFLLPLSKMTGGIYYEHTHRLFASLVGFVTIALFVFVLATDRRRWLWGVAGLALLLVIAQGVMGGIRVTSAPPTDREAAVEPTTQPEARAVASGEFTDAARETVASQVLRVAHGVTGQLFFGLLVALAAFTSASWFREPRRPPAELEERVAARRLLVLLVLQLVLGALTRHIGQSPWIVLHLIVALVVVMVAVLAAALARRSGEEVPILRPLGTSLLVLILAQFALGVLAFGVTRVAGTGTRVIITTLHQCVGALLLAIAVLLVAWSHRLREPGRRESLAQAAH